MFNKVLPILGIFLLSIRRVEAQSGTIAVGPLLTCGITTFSCPGTSGCCTIGGCCGGGCCANGYTCINEGTSDEACCPASDSTKCGTAAAPSSSPSGEHTCTSIEACPAVTEDGVGWTCLLGMTCGFSYEECNPCPYLGSGGSNSSSISYAGSSYTPITSSSGSGVSSVPVSDAESSTISSISAETTPSSVGSPGASSTDSTISPASSTTAGSGSTASSGYRSNESGLGIRWLVAISLGGVLAIAILCI